MSKSADQNQAATKQDLLAVKQDVQAVRQDVQEVKRDVQEVKRDVEALKQEVQEVKQDVQEVKQEVQEVKQDITALKTDHKLDLIALEGRLAKLFSDGLQLIADQFDKQNRVMATKADINNLKRDLTKTSTTTRSNANTIKKLKRALTA